MNDLFAGVFRKIGRDKTDLERKDRLDAEEDAQREASQQIVRYYMVQTSLVLTWAVTVSWLIWVLLHD